MQRRWIFEPHPSAPYEQQMGSLERVTVKPLMMLHI